MVKYLKEIIAGILMVAIGVAVFIFIFNRGEGSEDNPKPVMSMTEAQAKCTLMEQADLVNLMGEPYGDATFEKADKTCRHSWDKVNNPNASEEKFAEITASDWEERKTEKLNGHTLEELYNELAK